MIVLFFISVALIGLISIVVDMIINKNSDVVENYYID